MPITSPLPYFLLAPCLIGVAGLRGLLAMSVLCSHAVVNYFYFQTGIWSDQRRNKRSALPNAILSRSAGATGNASRNARPTAFSLYG